MHVYNERYIHNIGMATNMLAVYLHIEQLHDGPSHTIIFKANCTFFKIEGNVTLYQLKKCICLYDVQ